MPSAMIRTLDNPEFTELKYGWQTIAMLYLEVDATKMKWCN